eukprot:scaffold865_cov312-Prasinococcus_capsulatus_cf.AAC.16
MVILTTATMMLMISAVYRCEHPAGGLGALGVVPVPARPPGGWPAAPDPHGLGRGVPQLHARGDAGHGQERPGASAQEGP